MVLFFFVLNFVRILSAYCGLLFVLRITEHEYLLFVALSCRSVLILTGRKLYFDICISSKVLCVGDDMLKTAFLPLFTYTSTHF